MTSTSSAPHRVFHLSLRTSHCGQAALALLAPKSLARDAFPEARSDFERSSLLDDLARACLLACGGRPDAGAPSLALPPGLFLGEWSCPTLGAFRPAGGFGMRSGIATAAAAALRAQASLPHGLIALALDFGESWTDSIQRNLGSKISAAMPAARAWAERSEIMESAGRAAVGARARL